MTVLPKIAKSLLFLLALLPLRLNLKLGAAVGHLFYLFSNRHSRIIEQNLALCYPDISSDERRQLLKQSWIELGKNVTELGPFWFWNKDRVKKLVCKQSGTEHLTAALSQNKGVILSAPHIGAWELIPLKITVDRPMHFLFRPGRKSTFDDLIINARERFGGKAYPINRRGISALVRALKQGEMVGILPDQEPAQDHGVFAPLFNHPAYTMTFLTNLAQKTGAPIVFATMQRLPDHTGYHLHFFPSKQALLDTDPLTAATALNHHVEQCIAVAPDQYIWTYKRFKKTPVGGEKRYH